jgi:hypothetical protein
MMLPLAKDHLGNLKLAEARKKLSLEVLEVASPTILLLF